jgi:hypothetical protein
MRDCESEQQPVGFLAGRAAYHMCSASSSSRQRGRLSEASESERERKCVCVSGAAMRCELEVRCTTRSKQGCTSPGDTSGWCGVVDRPLYSRDRETFAGLSPTLPTVLRNTQDAVRADQQFTSTAAALLAAAGDE